MQTMRLKLSQLKIKLTNLYAGVLLLLFLPAGAQAGYLSNSICRTYRQIVDPDLFMWAAVCATVVALIAAKMSGGSKVLGNVLAIVAILGGLMSVEAIISATTGRSLICS